jgi:hypothetical protein
MRQAKRVPSTATFVLTFAVVVSVVGGCTHNQRTSGADDGARAPLFSKPAGEFDNESPNGAPTQLGGPFGNGVETAYSSHVLPLSTVRLDETMNDADLVSYLNKLIYDLNLENGQLILAPCNKGINPCDNGETAPMFIQPEVGMNSLDVHTIGANGVVVARLINYDPADRMSRGFHVPAHSRAWWVVRRNNQNQLESLFIGRDFSNPRRITVRKLRATGFSACPDHTPDANRPSIARWWDCGGSRRFSPRPWTRYRTSSAASYLRFVSNRGGSSPTIVAASDTSLRDDSTWITCSLGCCVAQ